MLTFVASIAEQHAILAINSTADLTCRELLKADQLIQRHFLVQLNGSQQMIAFNVAVDSNLAELLSIDRTSLHNFAPLLDAREAEDVIANGRLSDLLICRERQQADWTLLHPRTVR